MFKLPKILLTSEHKYLFGFAFFVGLLSILDLSVDLSRGVSWFHLFMEGSVILTSSSIIIKILQKTRYQKKLILEKVATLETESFALRADIKNYRIGISDLIDRQFEDWGLSRSEKEVGLLLLKGLSIKEIADARKTAEKTVRHQAGIIYSKARLEGRAQLSAFFLEDMLISNQE
jgi:DNA-binding CsgD family transcriptional regulator